MQTERRRSEREVLKKRASIVLTRSGHGESYPCLVLDSTGEGFRVRGPFRLRRGQIVEIVLQEDPMKSVRCTVIWAGQPGSKQEGEAGLQTS